MELDPDSALAHHYLGTAFFDEQKLDAAETEFRHAVRLEPSANNHYYLAATLMTEGRYNEALKELESSTRLAPTQTLYQTRKQELLQLMRTSSAR